MNLLEDIYLSHIKENVLANCSNTFKFLLSCEYSLKNEAISLFEAFKDKLIENFNEINHQV